MVSDTEIYPVKNPHAVSPSSFYNGTQVLFNVDFHQVVLLCVEEGDDVQCGRPQYCSGVYTTASGHIWHKPYFQQLCNDACSRLGPTLIMLQCGHCTATAGCLQGAALHLAAAAELCHFNHAALLCQCMIHVTTVCVCFSVNVCGPSAVC